MAEKNPFADPRYGLESGEKKQANPFSDPNYGKEREGRGFLGHARDLGLSVAKGVVAVPESAVGLVDIPTQGRVGRFLENKGGMVGFRPAEAKQFLGELQTDQQKAQQQGFQDADGILEKTGYTLKNPSLIANAVAESVPSMLGGGALAKGIRALTPAVAPLVAGAIGEGVVMAGSQASHIRQQTDDGLLTPAQSGAALATGAMGSLFSIAGGRLARKLGIGDVDTLLASGVQPGQLAGEIAGMPAKNIPRKVIEGAITEGFLEELPQSASEQILQNLALNKEWAEGLDEAVVMGTLAGMAMGGTAGALSGGRTRQESAPTKAPFTEDPAQTGPLPELPAPIYEVGPDGETRTTADFNAAIQAQRRAEAERQERIRRGDVMDVTPVRQASDEPMSRAIPEITPRLPAPIYEVGPDGVTRTTADLNAATQAQRRAEAERQERIRRGDVMDVTPIPRAPTTSEQMGLDPAAGPLTAAAAGAVDAGVSEQLTLQAASPVSPDASQARLNGTEEVDLQTGEIRNVREDSAVDSVAGINASMAHVRQQARVSGWNEVTTREYARLQSALNRLTSRSPQENEHAKHSLPPPAETTQATKPLTPRTTAKQAQTATTVETEGNTAPFRRGAIGDKLTSGEVVTTSSGRQTTPFPKIQTDTSRKVNATVKATGRWLMQNALDEARSRGDDFNARQFAANLDRPQKADKDAAEHYLFGQQPTGQAPVSRPLSATQDRPQTEESAAQWNAMTSAQRRELASRAEIKPVFAKNLPNANWERIGPTVRAQLSSQMSATAPTQQGRQPASWVLKNKQTGEVITETYDPKKVEALNTEKYEAVPIQQHLASLSRRPALSDKPVKDTPTSAVAPKKLPDEQAPDEFPVREAATSYIGISHRGNARAKQDAEEFDTYLQVARDAGAALAKTAAQREAVEQASAALRADYLAQYRHLMNARAGAYSGHIAGRSNLNSSQVSKRGARYDSASAEFKKWQSENQERVRKAVLDARTDAEKDADSKAKEQLRADQELRKENSDRAMMRKILSWKKGGEPVLAGKNGSIVGVNYGRDGYPTSIKIAAADGSRLVNENIAIRELFHRRGAPAQETNQRVRELTDAVRAENARKQQIAVDAELKPTESNPDTAVQSNSLTPVLDAQAALMKRVRNAEASVDEFKSAFLRLESNQDALLAELRSKTKDSLMQMGGYNFFSRYKGEKKNTVISTLAMRIMDDFALDRTYGPNGFFMSDSGMEAHTKAKALALRELVANTTEGDLQQFAAEYAEKIKEVKARRETLRQAVTNPQTLSDFRQAVSYNMEAHGETHRQAFMRLSPEQRIRYDELEAETTKAQREQAKAKSQVASAGQTTAGEIIKTQHTKHGHDLYVVQLVERVSREDYQTLNASAKRLGGSYSSFRGNGAVPGFQFRDQEGAEAFRKLVAGDTADAQTLAAQRRSAFDEDSSQSAAERLKTMADALNARANESLGRARKQNTERRARMAASAEASARADKALAGTMTNLSLAIDSGQVRFLDAVRQKVQVEFLESALRNAKSDQIHATAENYSEEMKRKGEAIDAETFDYASFPTYSAMRSDLASLARQMMDVSGLKKLGARLEKVADDVSDAYIEWAKQNLLSVSRFSQGDQLAEFTSRDLAERAIRISGLSGKAIVLPVMRGQNRIVMAPGEAMKLGLWQGDGDKRITLSSEFGKELVQAVGRHSGSKITVPWALEGAHERRTRLERMGIFTGSEYRSALREFASIREQASPPDKIMEMERSIIGRSNDGLDFFPTSEPVIQTMLEAAEVTSGMRVLEPSAGMGHIADAIRAQTEVEPDVVELSGERRDLLEAKGYHLVASDFMEMKDGQYDRIIMNPPFSKGRDIHHVMHAYELLRPGGRIVAIMGEGAFFQSNKGAERFRAWLEDLGATSERLPERSFMDPSLPVNTAVNARLVVIDKESSSDSTDADMPKFSFAGRTAQNADLLSLNTAMGRIAQGENPDQVRQDTGWHRGTDGKWRFEISDDQASIAVAGIDAESALAYAKLAAMASGRSNATLGDLLHHPQLFAAYPSLAQVPIGLTPLDAGVQARVRRFPGGNRVELNRRLPRGDLVSTVMHEVQHLLQMAEGFAAGGSRKALSSDLDPSGAATYRRLAGEVEARNTQARLKMTPRLRRDIAPEESADVPADQVLVSFNGRDIESQPRNAKHSYPPMTPESLVRAFSIQFPRLAPAVSRMLSLGQKGQRGGVVVIDSSDPLKIAATFSRKTGSDLSRAVELFSDNGQIQGFYDGKSGLTFLVGPNLNPITGPAVLLHEITHSQQRQNIDRAAVDLLMNRDAVRNAQLREFLDRVAQRMIAAGESRNSAEAAPYIVEQAVIEGHEQGFFQVDSRFLDWLDQTLGQRVGKLVRDFTKMLRQWMLRHGLGIKSISVDDLVSYAMAGVERSIVASVRGDGLAMSQSDLQKAIILQGAPVAVLEGNEAPQGFAAVRAWATNLFEQQGGMANSPELGAVLLDGRAVRDTMAHGKANPYKFSAFAAVKDVLEHGALVHQAVHEGKESFYVSAPVVIDGKDDVVTVLVRRDTNKQRMYLHSVTTKEYLLSRRVSSADTARADQASGSSDSEDVASVLQRLLSANVSDASLFQGGRPVFSRRIPHVARTAGAVLEHDAVKVIVEKIGKTFGFGVPIQVHRSEAALFAAAPEIKRQAEQDSAENQINAVYHQGVIHVVTSAFTREADVELAILDALAHEGQGHYGIRSLFDGDRVAIDAALQEFFSAIGGVSGVRRLAAKHGFDMSLYLQTAAGMGQRQQAGYLADELLAHLQGSAATASLSQRALAAVRTYLGAVREWLRNHGFSNLAKGTDADIAWLLKRMRDASRIKVESLMRPASTIAEAREAAKAYQGEPLTNSATGMRAVLGRNALDKMLSGSAARKSQSTAAHLQAVANADRLFERAVHGWKKADRDGKTSYTAIHRFFTSMEFDGRSLLVKLTVKETAIETQPNSLYTVEAVEVDEESPAVKWLDAAAKADGVDLISKPLTEDVFKLAQQIETANTQRDNNATDSDIRFSRSAARDFTRRATLELNRTFNAPGKLSWWHKTIGTMYNLAERSPAFKPVFEAAQRFIDDVAYYANDAAELAPSLLPRLETWRDIFRSPIKSGDNKAVAKPVFEGTLLWTRDATGQPVRVESLAERAMHLSTEEKADSLLKQGKLPEGVLRAWRGLGAEQFAKMIDSRYETQMLKAGIVWTDAELRTLFKLNDEQIALYREFRAATDRSLDTMARADMLRFAGADGKDLRDQVMDAPDAQAGARILSEHFMQTAEQWPDRATQLLNLAHGVKDRAAKVAELQAEGYAPLSRFGKYTVDVVSPEGERQYFSLFETKREANLMAEQMRTAFPQAAITQGTLSNESYKLFAGITPETLELFGNALGFDAQGDSVRDQAFQEYLRLTKTNRSAMRRLIHRKGIAGYNEDVGRVLSSFIYSNSRQTAANLHMGDLNESVDAIPQAQGELKDAAVRLAEYVRNPQEEGQAIRGLLFAQYLGGSVASAFVNMTQPAQVTFPWLSQYGGAKQAASQLAKAAKHMATRGYQFEPDLAHALKRAEDDGVVSPQEVHQLMAQARGSGSLRAGDGTRLGDARAMASNSLGRLSVAWGKLFGAAEQVNRRMTYIASYRIAKQQGMQDPDAFARRAVRETQFVYSKAAKMRWGRGAVGGTLMTFKTYSVSYLELMHRLWNQGEPGTQERREGQKAAALMVGMLLLVGGAGGLPFAEDAEDLIDVAGQLMGYNFSSAKAKQEFLENLFGPTLASIVNRGVSGLPGAPIDVSGRLGMGNLIPGTRLLQSSPANIRDVMEVAGPVGDFANRMLEGGKKIASGHVGSGLLEMAPVAVRNAAKGADMLATGMYRDAKGYKVLDTNTLEAAMKAIGFQPASVASIQEANVLNQRAKSYYNIKAQEIRSMWAAGIFEKDRSKVASARQAIEDWNRRNPEQPMRIRVPDVLRRAREMALSKDERIAKTAPRAMRQQMREELIRTRAAME
jgi:hypothetical protein